jgi:hypothetical protein
MKQITLKLNLNVKKTRKQVFLGQMEKVAPWAALVELIAASQRLLMANYSDRPQHIKYFAF